MKKSVLAALAVLSILVAGVMPAAADEFHYINILVGDRSSGMGGAYTAVSDDPSGMFYNPAGIAYASGRNISASVNAYHVTNKTYDQVIGGNGWTRTSSSLLPNYFGVIQPLGKLKVGFSYAVPESSLEDQDQIFFNLPSSIPDVTVDRYAINFNNSDTINLFGPSLAMEVSERFSYGTTLYVSKRSSHLIFNQYVQLSDSRFEWTNQYLETDEWGARPVLGVMWSPVDNVSIGLTAAKTFVLSSETSSQRSISTNVYVPGQAPFIRDVTDSKRKYPYQFKLGAALFPSPNLLISGDVSYFTAEEYTFDRAQISKEAVVNGSLGVEYYLNPTWAVRAGLYTDRSNSPEITGNEPGMAEKIDLYGGSLTLSRFTRNTSLTAGGSFNYGTGKAHVKAGSDIQDATSTSWTMFLSSSYAY